MRYGYDKKNDCRVFIDDTVSGIEYFCPLCGIKLVEKKGSVNQHHFAHITKKDCDDWYDSKSKWHRNMQSLFPADTQEVSLISEQGKHRADVLLKNTIIEFQKSPITHDVFFDRTKFYINNKNLIWVFNFTSKKIVKLRDGTFWWPHHSRFFDEIKPYGKTQNGNKLQLIFLIREYKDWRAYDSGYCEELEILDYENYEDKIVVLNFSYKNYLYFAGEEFEYNYLDDVSELIKKIVIGNTEEVA